MNLTAPDDVVSVTLSMPTGPVTIDGPSVDIDDALVAAELVALGWQPSKPAKKTSASKADS